VRDDHHGLPSANAKPLTIHFQSAKITVTIERIVHAGMVQLVECLLAKEKVTGSNPVARSEDQIAATWPSWQGKGLQNPHHEFESRRRLLER
jgi:hypothetical protein